ncbi:Fat storage-inducing transmembrane protein [Suillus bovinus]|uniref:Fat storage-inducing transmembrane protein n=1 Tax=Suillus bovinus TaxID=48563 RepID=UPI001B883F92|nr:Fat storage-inducing transmembrane protein [Suillus bovinus]KAG2132421.1 Fat storage-inducing transmembrane protein [Suillus bovinus]
MSVDVRYAAFAGITAILLFGTLYSVAYDTYLDTSNPVLTHLPHHLHATHYFANKSNILNSYFIKRAWGWTSAAFLTLWLTSPPHKRTVNRVLKWGVETAVWLVFTSWFFGPALLERLTAASGGECMATFRSGDVFTVPYEYCLTRTAISQETHPFLFVGSFAESSLRVPDDRLPVIPRLRKGHDVSGHVFLLTMSVLFLVDQIRPSLYARSWSPPHACAVAFNIALVTIWLFAISTTSVYFHTPFEKFTGYLLGVAGYMVTLLY